MAHYTYAVRSEANAVAVYDDRDGFVGEVRVWAFPNHRVLGIRDAVGPVGRWERPTVLEPWHRTGMGRRALPTWADEALALIED